MLHLSKGLVYLCDKLGFVDQIVYVALVLPDQLLLAINLRLDFI
jgi:hypothetical protein